MHKNKLMYNFESLPEINKVLLSKCIPKISKLFIDILYIKFNYINFVLLRKDSTFIKVIILVENFHTFSFKK